MSFTRYALYAAPPAADAWSRFCTSWLGWDMETAQELPFPDLMGLNVAEITETPRKYGLHATIKPPFRLAEGHTQGDLETACAALCAQLAPVALPDLSVTPLGRFLALCPQPQPTALTDLAATCVRALDPFRAPPTEAELAKRRQSRLSPAQEQNLTRWGYPYVMEQFRFHITLTSRLPKAEIPTVQQALDTALAALLPNPYLIDDLALVGERTDGRFELIHRYALTGNSAA